MMRQSPTIVYILASMTNSQNSDACRKSRLITKQHSILVSLYGSEWSQGKILFALLLSNS